jgi:hypothetical protein
MIPIATAAGGSGDGSDDRLDLARSLLLKLGRKRFGEPPPEVELQIRRVADLDRLEALYDRLLVVMNWQELLAES